MDTNVPRFSPLFQSPAERGRGPRWGLVARGSDHAKRLFLFRIIARIALDSTPKCTGHFIASIVENLVRRQKPQAFARAMILAGLDSEQGRLAERGDGVFFRRIGRITDIADGQKALAGWVLAAGCGGVGDEFVPERPASR